MLKTTQTASKQLQIYNKSVDMLNYLEAELNNDLNAIRIASMVTEIKMMAAELLEGEEKFTVMRTWGNPLTKKESENVTRKLYKRGLMVLKPTPKKTINKRRVKDDKKVQG